MNNIFLCVAVAYEDGQFYALFNTPTTMTHVTLNHTAT